MSFICSLSGRKSTVNIVYFRNNNQRIILSHVTQGIRIKAMIFFEQLIYPDIGMRSKEKCLL